MLRTCPLLLSMTSSAIADPRDQQVVIPGALTTRGSSSGSGSGGNGGGRRWRERLTPAAGFFVAGSTINAMNGIYSRIPDGDIGASAHLASYRYLQLAYKHDRSDWSMALVGPPDEEDGGYDYQLTGAFENEWVFVDESGIDRFGHEGRTLHPGSGTRWQHLHRHHAMGNGVQVPGQTWGNNDELPWQVVAVLDQESLDGLRQREAEREHNLQRIRMLAAPKYSNSTGNGTGNSTGNSKGNSTGNSTGDSAGNSKGHCTDNNSTCTQAEQRLQHAASLRRQRDNSTPLKLRNGLAASLLELLELRAALLHTPQHASILFELGVARLDNCEPHLAILSFEALLRVERSKPGLADWLVRAHVARFRHCTCTLAGGESEEEEEEGECTGSGGGGDDAGSEVVDCACSCDQDHYSVLDVPHDFTASELKSRYRRASLQLHPDKEGGSAEKFGQVATAYEKLSGAQRIHYDEGDDVDFPSFGLERKHELESWLWRRARPKFVPPGTAALDTLRSHVVYRYFPEQFDFHPFGDPLVEKRSGINHTIALLRKARRLKKAQERRKRAKSSERY